MKMTVIQKLYTMKLEDHEELSKQNHFLATGVCYLVRYVILSRSFGQVSLEGTSILMRVGVLIITEGLVQTCIFISAFKEHLSICHFSLWYAP